MLHARSHILIPNDLKSVHNVKISKLGFAESVNQSYILLTRQTLKVVEIVWNVKMINSQTPPPPPKKKKRKKKEKKKLFADLASYSVINSNTLTIIMISAMLMDGI